MRNINFVRFCNIVRKDLDTNFRMVCILKVKSSTLRYPSLWKIAFSELAELVV